MDPDEEIQTESGNSDPSFMRESEERPMKRVAWYSRKKRPMTSIEVDLAERQQKIKEERAEKRKARKEKRKARAEKFKESSKAFAEKTADVTKKTVSASKRALQESQERKKARREEARSRRAQSSGYPDMMDEMDEPSFRDMPMSRPPSTPRTPKRRTMQFESEERDIFTESEPKMRRTPPQTAHRGSTGKKSTAARKKSTKSRSTGKKKTYAKTSSKKKTTKRKKDTRSQIEKWAEDGLW